MDCPEDKSGDKGSFNEDCFGGGAEVEDRCVPLVSRREIEAVVFDSMGGADDNPFGCIINGGGANFGFLLLLSGASCSIFRRRSRAWEVAGVDDSEEGGVNSSIGGVIGRISSEGRGDIDCREEEGDSREELLA